MSVGLLVNIHKTTEMSTYKWHILCKNATLNSPITRMEAVSKHYFTEFSHITNNTPFQRILYLFWE